MGAPEINNAEAVEMMNRCKNEIFGDYRSLYLDATTSIAEVRLSSSPPEKT